MIKNAISLCLLSFVIGSSICAEEIPREDVPKELRQQIKEVVSMGIDKIKEVSFSYESSFNREGSDTSITRTEGYFHFSTKQNKAYCSYSEKNSKEHQSIPADRQILYDTDGLMNAGHNFSFEHEWFIFVDSENEYSDKDIISNTGFANLLGRCVVTKFDFDEPVFFSYSLSEIFDDMHLEIIKDPERGFVKGSVTKDGMLFFIEFDPSKNYVWTTINRIHEDRENKGQFIRNYYEASNYILVDGVYLPTLVRAGYCRGNMQDKGISFIDKENVDTVEYRFSNYRVGDAYDDFELKNVPNGTPVFVEKIPQIQYIWMDGKIVPKTDERMLALARGHKFMPGPQESQFWLILSAILLIVIGGGARLYQFMKSEE